MASNVSIAIRKDAALERIASALGVSLAVQAKTAALREVAILEAIADAADADKPRAPKSSARKKT